MAQRRAEEARLGIGQGRVESIAENRRTGRSTIDPAVPVLRFDDAAGEPIAVLFSFTLEADRMRAEGVPWARVSGAEIRRDWTADGIH